MALIPGATPLNAALSNAADVRRLEAAEARKEYPVHIHGVVTWANIRNGELFVQDGSAGIFVFIRNSTADAPLRAGLIVDVDGVTAPGDFSSSITKAKIHVVRINGLSKMPNPVRLPFDRILTGEQDSQWGHLEGVVRSGREEAGVLYLNTVTLGGVFLAIMKDYPEDWSTRLVDSKLSVEGVLAAVFNDRRQVSGVRIFIPGRQFLRVDEPAPASPFELPRSSALRVGSFHLDQGLSHGWIHRIRVRAAVTAVASRSLIYVSEGDGNLAIGLDSPCEDKPGSLLDIVGFPGTIDGRPGLQNGVCRFITRGRKNQAAGMLASDILPQESEAQGSGLAIAGGTRDDLKLVTIAGTLVQITRGVRSQTLTVASDDQSFTVMLPESTVWAEESLQPGTHLKATGVCLIGFDEYHRAQSFRLLARDAADIEIISRPPWLTMARALWIMVPMALFVLAAVVWIVVLRRHVAGKTHELRRANEHLQQAAVEDPLTGASNRRRFAEMLETAVSHCRRHSVPLSLVMVDIDHFKAVNDLYGHQHGDQCLIRVVGALRRAIFPREEALVARYGGEEFIVLLPDTADNAAELVAEAMRTTVEELAIPHQHSPFNQCLTVSVGVATVLPGPPCLPAELIDMADRALYEAKQLGRNRVVRFSPASRNDSSEWVVTSNI